jgi:hypothetical protein
LRDRRAKNDEVGVFDGAPEIGVSVINSAGPFAFSDTSGATDITDDLLRKFPLPERKPDRAAEQANANESYLLPTGHAPELKREKTLGKGGK